MSEKKIRTTGELRDFIAATIVEVKEGKIDIERANRITKLCSQINENFYAEIKVAQVIFEAGHVMNKLGATKIGA